MPPSRIIVRPTIPVNIYRIYSGLFAAAIGLTAYSFVVESQRYLLPLVQAVFIMLPLAMMSMTPALLQFNQYNLIFVLVLTLMMLLNVIVNLHRYSELTVSAQFVLLHITGLAGMLFALQWAATNLSPQLIFRWLAYILTPLIFWAIYVSVGQSTSVRAAPFGLHPNWWGELTFAYVFCVLSLPRLRYRVVLIVISLFFLYILRSRSGLTGVAACLGSYFFMLKAPWYWHKRTIKTSYFFAGIVLVTLTLLLHQYLEAALYFFLHEVLLLNDPYRGLGTGFTGRLEGWGSALGTFYENPLFGAGIDTLSEVHNGFLRLAGEGGLLLCTAVLLPLALTLIHATREKNHLAVAMILGYSAYVMFQPRMLNMNVASMLFFLCLFRWNSTGITGTEPRLKNAQSYIAQ